MIPKIFGGNRGNSHERGLISRSAITATESYKQSCLPLDRGVKISPPKDEAEGKSSQPLGLRPARPFPGGR